MKSQNKYIRKITITSHLLFLISLVSFSSPTIAAELKSADCPLPAEAIEIFSDDNPRNVTSVNGAVFFTTDNDSSLWKHDESSNETIHIKGFDFDVESHTGDWIKTLINVNGTLFFIVRYSNSIDYDHSSLWKSDGTPQGTIKVANIGGETTGLTVVGDTLFFASTDYLDLVNNYEDVKSWLWKSDGNETGTLKIMNLESDPLNNDYAFVSHGGSDPRLSFFETDSETGDLDFWTIKETQTGVPDRVQTIDDLTVNKVINVKGLLAIFATNSSGELELWGNSDDGHGAHKIKDIPGGTISEATVVRGTLYFTISDDETNTQNLWKSDGMDEGTVIVQNFDGNPVSNLSDVYGTLYFSSQAGDTGNALWRFDGTQDVATVIIQDIDKPIENIMEVTGELFFFTMDEASDESYAKDLFRYSAEEGAVNIFSSVDSFDGGYDDYFEFEADFSTSTLYFGLSDNKLHKYEAGCSSD